ncbi:MAG: hypothetical protein HY698_18375, partial [Deltaproteobacteria bacterium]|nr:hypothetical protein [Deltaproteobacteria bacterium]
MSRNSNIARLALFLSLSLLSGACGVGDYLFGESQRESEATDDAGACVRDLEALTKLLVEPQACVSSSTCPMGSTCNASTGACDWQCYTDSDCGPSGTCTCLGQCLGADAGPGPTGDPSCPRNRDLLLAPETKTRECVFDEECPHGSRCDSGTRTCTWDCLDTNDATHGCGAGAICNCLGRCVATGTPEAHAGDKRLHMEVGPTLITVVPPPSGGWSQRRIDVALWAPEAPTSSQLAGVTIHAKADPGLLVTCEASAAPSTSCALPNWVPTSFLPEDRVLRATRYVWVSPKTPGTGETLALEGGVTFSSDEVLGSPRVVTITPPGPAPNGTTVGTFQPYEGEYTGHVTFLGVSNSAGGVGQQSVVSPKLPVRAFASSSAIDLVDDLNVLTPTGKLRLPNTGTLFFTWLDPATSDSADVTGSLMASVTPVSRTHAPQAGTISGRFRTQVSFSPSASSGNSHLHWSYTLTRVGPNKTCTAPTDCPAGRECDGGICTAGGKWVSSPSSTWNQIVSTRDKPWLDWLSTIISYTVNTLSEKLVLCLLGFPCPSGYPNLFLANDVYDSILGFASPSIETHSQILGADRIAQSPLSFGYTACGRDFRSYVTWMNDQKVAGADINAYVYSQAGSILSTLDICPNLYATPTNFYGLVPCIDPTPASAPT